MDISLNSELNQLPGFEVGQKHLNLWYRMSFK